MFCIYKALLQTSHLVLFLFLSASASWAFVPAAPSFSPIPACPPIPLWPSRHHKLHIPQCFCSSQPATTVLKKEIKAQKLKLAQDHSSDVVITSEVNIF